MDFRELFAIEAIEKLRTQELSCKELIQNIFETIDKFEPKIHSYVNLSEKQALKKAEKLDKTNDPNKFKKKLYGLPFANKDLICVKNFPTTCCSKILHNYKPPYNASVIQSVVDKEGAVHIGNTNMDEFAMGSSTENSCFGPTYNPWDLARVPGGSSGGAAAAVASGLAMIALGSDTGGSVRCPAAFCGVVGLKPTYGRVSRYGLIAFANSLDQIGPITKCVYDSALMLEVISGKDPLDSTSVNIKVDQYTNEIKKEIKGKKIGVPKEFFGEGIDKVVNQSVKKSIHRLEGLGAKIVDVSIPNLEYSVATYYLTCMSEASSNLARYDGLRYGEMAEDVRGNVFDAFSKTRGELFGAEVKRRIFLGTYILSAGYYDMYYIKALKVRTLIKRDFQQVFKTCDCIASPTMPITAFKIGELIDNPIQMYMIDILTCPVNLAGLPAISIPCGFDNYNLPIGFQLIGNHFDEKTILNVAYHLEQDLNINRKKPIISKI